VQNFNSPDKILRNDKIEDDIPEEDIDENYDDDEFNQSEKKDKNI
jgi:hypothetical protein